MGTGFPLKRVETHVARKTGRQTYGFLRIHRAASHRPQPRSGSGQQDRDSQREPAAHDRRERVRGSGADNRLHAIQRDQLHGSVRSER